MPTKKKPWKFIEKSGHVHELQFNGIKKGWEQWILLLADEHWDNPKCNRDLLKKHYDQAVERDALILSFGDLFCAMQGKFDKRSSKDDVRPEHQEGNYLDRLVETAAEWYAPYADRLLLIGQGNHEISILKHHETNLLDRLAERLRAGGGITRTGGYAGWVRFQFFRGQHSHSQRLYYMHGFGGGGPVTQGKIDWNRLQTFVDADIMIQGHVHYKELFPVPRVSLSETSNVVRKIMHMVRVGTYKDEYGTGGSNWHIENGRGPRPMGGYWLRFYYRNESGQDHGIHREFTETET